MWVFKRSIRPNALSHMLHLYGLSPVWTLRCLFRLPDTLYALSHRWHLYGFCPEWLLLWTVRPELLAHNMPHSMHSCLPVWIFICRRRPSWDQKHFPHWLQEHNCFLVWFSLWDVDISSLKQLPVQVKIPDTHEDMIKHTLRPKVCNSVQVQRLNKCANVQNSTLYRTFCRRFLQARWPNQ